MEPESQYAGDVTRSMPAAMRGRDTSFVVTG
jgi:hypothetical protein